jgi:GcrA cell cycle regulator
MLLTERPPPNPVSFWTREKDQAARALWVSGCSASRIAGAIGAASASAVMGRAWRRGWTRPAELARINHRFTHLPFEHCEEPLPPSPPTAIALAPRPWLSRSRGECAFPVDGEGWTTRSCCNPCGSAVYCAVHDALMAGPRTRPVEFLERALRPHIG